MDLMALPRHFHMRLVELLCSTDPRTRLRFSRTSRYFCGLTEKCPENQPGYDIAISGGPKRSLLIRGRGHNETESPLQRPSKLKFSGQTFSAEEIPDALDLPKNSKVWLNGSPWDSNASSPDLEAPDEKYARLELRVRNLSPELVRFINNHVDSVTWSGNPVSMSTLRCKKFTFALPKLYQATFGLFLNAVIADWEAGRRELVDAEISGAPTTPWVNFERERYRRDGKKLQVIRRGYGTYRIEVTGSCWVNMQNFHLQNI